MEACEVETYRDLLEKLKQLTEEQLDQKAMFMINEPEPVPLGSVIGIETAQFWGSETRSAKNNQHYPEQVILLCDRNPFDKEGNFCFTFTEAECPHCHKVVDALKGDTGTIKIEPHECVPPATNRFAPL